MNRIKTIDQFAVGQESGKSDVTYLDSRILTHGTEETILLLLDGVEAYFGSPNKGMFDANMFYRIGNEFPEQLNTLLDQVNVSCDLELDEIPKTMKEMMAISIPETKSRMQTIHNIFCNQLKLFEYSQGNKSAKLVTRASARQDRLLKKIRGYFFKAEVDNSKSNNASRMGMFTPRNVVTTRRNKRKRHDVNSKEIVEIDSDDFSEIAKKTSKKASQPGGKKTGKKSIMEELFSPPRKKQGSGNSGKSASTKKANPIPEPMPRRTKEQDIGPYDDAPPPDIHPIGCRIRNQIMLARCADVVTIEHMLVHRRAHLLRGWDNLKETEEGLKAKRQTTTMVDVPSSTAGRVSRTINDTKALLKSALIPLHHRDHIFFSYDQIWGLRNLAWVWGAYKQLQSMQFTSEIGDNELWLAANNDDNCFYSLAYYARKKQQLDSDGYCILEGLSDPFNVEEERMRGYVDAFTEDGHAFPTEPIADLFRKIEEWFPGEAALVNESDRDLWSPIINRGEIDHDEKDRNEGVGRYSSTRRLLENTFETSRDYVSLAERRAALDLWIGWVCSMLDVDNHCTWRTEIPNGGGRFLMTGKDCPPQHGHNDFDVRETGSPGYFTITTASEPISLWIAPGSQKYVHLSDIEKERIAMCLEMELITIPPQSIFVGHGYVQHAGAGWNGSGCLRYHMYIIPDGSNLRDAISYAFGRSLRRKGEIVSADISEQSNTPPQQQLSDNEDDDGDDNPDDGMEDEDDGDLEHWGVGEADEPELG